ncbi:MAG: L,D-transpeptidase family protein [Verrucomicrobia bacterium]|nr:MAG: L,D-transpeptidase family protein [Verrucomicrobiota bacterium]
MFKFLLLLLLPAALAAAQPAAAPTPPASRPQPNKPAAAPPQHPARVNPDAPDIPITPEKPKVAASVKPTGEEALSLQIFLDDSRFGPGIIDGKPGRFTELAVQSWNEAHGYPLDDWTAVLSAARQAVPTPLAVAVVPDCIKDWVNPDLPTKYTRQAKSKRMSYRSNGEFMAERYHCDEAYLAELNGNQKIDKLEPHQSITVPNVEPFTIEKITGATYKSDPVMSLRHAVVDTKINQVRIFEAAPAALVVAEPDGDSEAAAAPAAPRPNRGLIASFPITPGEARFIKFGVWEVRNAVELPIWRYDQQLLDTGKRSSDSESLEIPPGPNSPVGIFWAGLSKPGIGLHGTANPETIGRARSHGCIRLANWDAIRLPTLIRPGTRVEIR